MSPRQVGDVATVELDAESNLLRSLSAADWVRHDDGK